MAHTVMAILAQVWRTILQQWGDIRTVRRVAIGAALYDRLVFKQHGSAFFSMAQETGFIERVLLEQCWSG